MRSLRIFLLFGLMMLMIGAVMGQSMTAKDYFLLGSAKYKCRACDQAVEEFTKAIALDKGYAEAYYGRSLAYACAKDYTNAAMDIDRAIRLKPDEVLYYEGKARIKLESGKGLEAKAGFKTAIKMDSLCWQAWYGLATAEAKIDSLSNAKHAYSTAIRLRPDFPMSYLGRAESMIKLGDYTSALSDLMIAGELAPGYAKVFSMRSRAHMHLQHFEEAIADASKAVELDPEDGKAYFYRGEAYFAMEQYAKADEDYSIAISHDRNDANAWFKKALSNERLGLLPPAKKFYTKAVKKNRTIAAAWANRAAIWEKLDKPKKAIPDLGRAIALNPTDPSLRLRRGFLHLQTEHVLLAMDDFVQVTRIDPNSGQGFYGLGRARYENGNIQGACEAWKRGAALKDSLSEEQLAKFCNQ